tara:strand:+ start:191 stop:631 length:441 start_codon:yes stop_codon:yes gene_type:complete
MPKFVLKCVEVVEEDVCCVGCGEFICKFNEEPNHKNDRDEAVCELCVEVLELEHEGNIYYMNEEDGCLYGPDTSERVGWKIGDKIIIGNEGDEVTELIYKYKKYYHIKSDNNIYDSKTAEVVDITQWGMKTKLAIQVVDLLNKNLN